MAVILKDLSVLIRKSALHYSENCDNGDVILTDDFKKKFQEYLHGRDSDIDFNTYTAVAITSRGNYVFIPNQWFVIAAYGAGVYSELQEYKRNLLKVCKYMGKTPASFIPHLRSGATLQEHTEFIRVCKSIFEGYSEEEIILASERLWRFATDYQWWSGHKTADRADFHFSVLMDMLNLVSVSQTYVGDIVSAYANGGMMGMVSELSNFTENLEGPAYAIDDYSDPKETQVVVTDEEKRLDYSTVNGVINLTTKRNKHS